jgi:membrane protein YdbS with pleckstrin-like domain
MSGSWTQPRSAPDTTLPAIAGTVVVFLALPVFLWLASQAFGFLLHRLHSRTDNLAAAGVTAFGMMFRAIAVMVVVFAAAASDPWVGLAAALVYALGFTAELGLSLVSYYTGPTAGKAAE